MATSEDPDEWELLNIDGFVCKRKKRPRVDSYTADVPQQPQDPALERRRHRELQRKVLLKLRDKYLQEIAQWELLSNMLKGVEQSAQKTLQERQELVSPTSEQHSQPDSSSRRVVDDLLAQVEAQEAVIRKVSNLCDVAEALCIAQEDRLKQQLTDLPIWDPSPQELMSALGEQ